MKFTSNRSYLLRAIYEWVVDNEATPHVLLNADNPRTDVPTQFIENGKIILNISPTAAKDLLIDKEGISFSARFSGKPFNIYAPIGAVLALYASENGEGLSFEPEDDDPEDTPPTAEDSDNKSKNKKSNKKRPSLKVVK